MVKDGSGCDRCRMDRKMNQEKQTDCPIVDGVAPYYSMGGIQIYHADCLQILPLMRMKSVDGVITSPPYNQLEIQIREGSRNNGVHSGKKWFLKQQECYADAMPEREYQAFIAFVIALCMERSRGVVWVNHKLRYRDGVGIHPLSFLPFPLWSEIIWNRGGTMSMNPVRFFPVHEYVFGFGRPHWWDEKLAGRMSVWSVNPERGVDHPCPFPESLIGPLMASTIPPTGIVLDPFMGSGTTLLWRRTTAEKRSE